MSALPLNHVDENTIGEIIGGPLYGKGAIVFRPLHAWVELPLYARAFEVYRERCVAAQ